MKRHLLFLAVMCLLNVHYTMSQVIDRDRPDEWKGLVYGARFMDRFLPMPAGTLSDKSWGDPCVQPRYIDNGIEDNIRSYWGGNILMDKEDKFHLFVCGWPEDSAKGHATWPNSTVFHAISDKSTGPFVVVDTIGRGHNPEIYCLEDGRYVLYVIGRYYISDRLNGPWTNQKFAFDYRGRKKIAGLSNLTFSKREDGSFLMVSRGGGIWVSRTGISPYRKVTGRVYPNVKGDFEDPVVWRDHIQYHLIVNDWRGRIAYYQRSKDGVNWLTDPGEAYVPGIAVHEDGKKEDWFKYERIKILQDEYGRAIQANFAVVDILKENDKGNDNHSSKNLCIPLNPGMLLTVLETEPITTKSKTIRVKISAEKGFNPHTDIDIHSLRFGASAEVNQGRGCRAIGSQKDGNDLIVSFDAAGNGITSEEFAPKLLGKSAKGKLLYGYAQLPWVSYNDPILSACKPVFTAVSSGTEIDIEIENFGLAESQSGTLRMTVSGKGENEQIIGTVKTPPLKPYEKAKVKLSSSKSFEKGKFYNFEIEILTVDGIKSLLNFKDTPVNN